jgi:hypothetical protein
VIEARFTNHRRADHFKDPAADENIRNDSRQYGCS